MKPLVDPFAIEELARGESREHLADMGHDLPADLRDISEIKPEVLAVELGRLTRILDGEYRRAIEAAEPGPKQVETPEGPKPAEQSGRKYRRPKGHREKAWADMGESVKRKPPAYWS